jgi:hypothetical protein
MTKLYILEAIDELQFLYIPVDGVLLEIIGINELLPILETQPDREAQEDFKYKHNLMVQGMQNLVNDFCEEYYQTWENICEIIDYPWIAYIHSNLTILYYETLVGWDINPIQKVEKTGKSIWEDSERILDGKIPKLNYSDNLLVRQDAQHLSDQYPLYKVATLAMDNFRRFWYSDEAFSNQALIPLRRKLAGFAQSKTHELVKVGTEGIKKSFQCPICGRLDVAQLGRGTDELTTCYRPKCERKYEAFRKQIRRDELRKKKPFTELLMEWKALPKKKARCKSFQKGLICKNTAVTNDLEQLCKNCWLEINTQ